MRADMTSRRSPSLLVFVLALCALADARVHAEPDVSVVKRWIAAQGSYTTLHVVFRQERHLRALKKPIINTGKLWYSGAGAFRWQLGDPPVSLAIQERGGDLLALNPRKKDGKRYTRAELRDGGGAQGLAFLDGGYPRTWEEFNRNMRVTGVERTSAGTYEVTTALRDRKASLAVRKIVFQIDASTFHLQGFYLRFRDSSAIQTTFLKVIPNAKVSPSLFQADLTGYRIRQKGAR